MVASLGAGPLKVELLDGESALGGGAGPTSTFPTTLIAITHQEKSAQEIEHQLRSSSTPIISRISEGKVLLDLRTVFEDQLSALQEALRTLSIE
jgi:L-seryl-tRNA(Ser) seleniumtransferase